MNEFVKNLERIEFVVTMACTGKCKHCSQGNHDSVSEHFRADVAEKVISDICGKYKIQSLMTFGGEPLLYPEVVYRIHKAATEQRILSGIDNASKEILKGKGDYHGILF